MVQRRSLDGRQDFFYRTFFFFFLHACISMCSRRNDDCSPKLILVPTMVLSGDISMILVGDFGQLEPVDDRNILRVASSGTQTLASSLASRRTQ